MRECTKCKQLKPLTEYYKRSQSKDDGVQRRCKQCVNQEYKVYWQQTKFIQAQKRHAKQQLRFNLQNNKHNEPKVLHREEVFAQG